MTPYIVLGRWMVSWGVMSLGVEAPKAPMELGTKTAQPSWRATSSTRYMPPMLMLQATCGFSSATALKRAARWWMVPTS